MYSWRGNASSPMKKQGVSSVSFGSGSGGGRLIVPAFAPRKRAVIVNATVRFRARGTNMGPDSPVAGITQHQHNNTEEALVVVVDTATVYWLPDGYMLATLWSTNMRKVPAFLKAPSNLPPLVWGRWGAE